MDTNFNAALYQEEMLSLVNTAIKKLKAEPNWICVTKKSTIKSANIPHFSDIFSASETEIKTLGDILILCAFRDGVF